MKVDIDLSVLLSKVTVLIGPLAEVKRYLPKGLDLQEQEPYEAITACVRGKSDHFHAFIHMEEYVVGTLAHEAVHASQFIIKAIEQDVGAYEELQACTVGYIVDCVEAKLQA